MSLKGRPSKQGQIQIVKEIRPFFEKTMTATFTASKTGHDIKTVCKYFNEWARQIVETEDKEFIPRQKEAKELAILNLDYILSKEYELLEDMDQEIKKNKKEGKPISKYLITTKHKVLYDIAHMTQEKIALCMTPTLDVTPEYLVEYTRKNPRP